jgi:hypothetical protein
MTLEQCYYALAGIAGLWFIVICCSRFFGSISEREEAMIDEVDRALRNRLIDTAQRAYPGYKLSESLGKLYSEYQANLKMARAIPEESETKQDAINTCIARLKIIAEEMVAAFANEQYQKQQAAERDSSFAIQSHHTQGAAA